MMNTVKNNHKEENDMRKYSTPECMLVYTSAEDIMIASGGTLDIDNTENGYGVYQWPF